VAYVIGGTCVADYSCVEACPVDCIKPGPDDRGFDTTEQLYINPTQCIDCAACVDACPIDAVTHEDALPKPSAHYAEVNAAYFQNRPR
jgi:ferredoxin